jgi:hypothetical protein
VKNLRKSFEKYIELVRRKFRSKEPKIAEVEPRTPLMLVVNPAWQIQNNVQQVLETQEFGALLENTKSSLTLHEDVRRYFGYDYAYYFDFPDEDINTVEDKLWSLAVHNFFCRSGCYLKSFSGEDFEVKHLFEQFCEAFQKKGIKRVFLAPMEGVAFSRELPDYGDFQIRKFREDEIEKIFSNEINRVFYPKSFFDNGSLLDRWFICAEDFETWSSLVERYDQIHWYGGSKDFVVKHEYSNFPKKMESALNVLVLFDWRRIRGGSGNEHSWLEKFAIPFVLRANDNLIGFPEKQESSLQPLPTDYTPFWLLLNEGETEDFHSFMIQTKNLIDKIRSDAGKIEYLNHAIGYMVKGFFSKALDEFISYFIALEALVGEKGGVSNKLGTRVSKILGNTEDRRRGIGRQIKDLYDFRCSVLHGKEFEKPLYEGHLKKIKAHARSTILWYLNCLNYFKKKSEEDKTLTVFPTRSDILTLIDFGRSYIPIIKGFINTLPAGFPNVVEWLADGQVNAEGE